MIGLHPARVIHNAALAFADWRDISCCSAKTARGGRNSAETKGLALVLLPVLRDESRRHGAFSRRSGRGPALFQESAQSPVPHTLRPFDGRGGRIVRAH